MPSILYQCNFCAATKCAMLETCVDCEVRNEFTNLTLEEKQSVLHKVSLTYANQMKTHYIIRLSTTPVITYLHNIYEANNHTITTNVNRAVKFKSQIIAKAVSLRLKSATILTIIT